MNEGVREATLRQMHRSAPLPVLVLLGFAAIALLLKLRLNHTIDVHWDEFNFLSQIYRYEGGELRRAFLTFHVHVFGWLRHVSGNEVDQVIAARDWMYALRLGSTLCLFLIGKRLMGATGAAFAVFCSLSFSHILKHGESFRFDPPLSFLFLLACCLLILRPGRVFPGILAGVALAIAGLISLKLVLLLPSVALIFALHWLSGRSGSQGSEHEADRRDVLRQFWVCGASFAVAFGVLYAGHVASLPTPEMSDATFARTAASEYMVFSRFFPSVLDLARSLRWDYGFWPLFFLGSALAVGEVLSGPGERRRRALLLLALALPMTTIAWYRNTFAYWYVTIIPPASLLCGLVIARLADRFKERSLWVTGLAVLLALPSLIQLVRFYDYNSRDELAHQRELVDKVHRLFPEPVSYLDRGGMLASYPRVGPFMIVWSMRDYRERGQPVMEQLLREEQPLFLLANISSLNLTHDWELLKEFPQRLLREDFELLQRNFVRHWGAIWVAGKRFPELSPEPLHFEILIGGVYTLEASGPMRIDGQRKPPGSVVRLDPGPHRIRTAEGARSERSRAMLRYGEGLRRFRKNPPPQGAYFTKP